MLPVTHGVQYTKLHILLYTIILFLVTLLPWITGMFGLLYLSTAGNNPKAGMETFKYSIWYLLALFVAMIVDHYFFAPTITTMTLEAVQ